MQVLYTKMLQFGDERYDLEQAVDENKKKMKSGSSNTNSTLASELSKQLKECLIFLAESAQGNVLSIQIGSIYLLETAFVTLLNLGEFEFVLGSCGKEGAGPSGKLYRFRNLVQIVSLVSSAVLHIQNQQKQLQAGSRLNTTNAANRANAEDFKKTCRGLSDILLPCVEVSLTATKRGRGGSDVGSNPNKATKDSASARAWLVRFLKRLNHPEILTLLASFFISVYNMTVEDSSHEIQLGSSGSDLGLPVLPMNLGTSSEINEDSVLHLITAISIKGSKNALTQGIPWARIQAEVNFAQGNYLAALRFYIQSLMLTTHYFQKPWTKDSITSINIAATTAGENLGTSLPQPNQSTGFSVPTGFSSAGPSSANLLSSGGNGWDDRIFHGMIKCTSELGHHATTVVLCQFLGTDSADYPTAFRSLEDRGSNDCMDDMYPFLWDVTALECAVSMHTKRGEFSRKRRALETISQLEINTNNNEEILREARATRRSAFLRYMASSFL
jgi:integrator complex subunit 8